MLVGELVLSSPSKSIGEKNLQDTSCKNHCQSDFPSHVNLQPQYDREWEDQDECISDQRENSDYNVRPGICRAACKGCATPFLAFPGDTIHSSNYNIHAVEHGHEYDPEVGCAS